jgi:hypothetical protein
MSINALTNAAVARRSDFQPEGAVPTSLAEIASAAVAAPVPVAAGVPTAAATSAAASGPNTALQTLTTYIPTEVLTLYVERDRSAWSLDDKDWSARSAGRALAAILVLFCRDAADSVGRVRLENKDGGKNDPAASVDMAVMGDGRRDHRVRGVDFRAAGDSLRRRRVGTRRDSPRS